MFGKKEEAAGDAPAEGGEEAKAGDPEKGDASADVGAMKGGDYMIHVFIEKVKEINIPDEKSTVDPIIEINCMGMKTFSTSKDDIGGLGEVNWSEHLFIEPKGVDKEEAENGKIMIKLMDKGIFKDVIIGEFEFDLSFIYFMKDHTMLHKWLALSNPNCDDFAKIQAYMKVSISVAVEGDEQIQITDDDAVNEDTSIMMSPALNPKFYQLKIRIFQGQDLPPMDEKVGFIGSNKIDAYLVCEFKGKKNKTRTLTYEQGSKDYANFDREFWLPAQLPVLCPMIKIKLMDEDFGNDQCAGTMIFKTKRLIENGNEGAFVWKNIYGSPVEASSSQFKSTMNENPEFASSWKGRVLVQCLAEPTEKPLWQKRPIEADIVEQAQAALKDKQYSIIAQVGQAVALPSDRPYKIRITLGGREIMFEPFEQRNPSCYKRYGRSKQEDFDSPYVDCHDFGRLIIQLLDGKKPICYYADDVSNYLDPDPKMKWVPFIPDQSIGIVKEAHKAGMFSFKLSLHDVTREGPIDFKKFKSWKRPVPKRANSVKIRAYVYQCMDLPAADAEGTSDPYVSVWDINKEEKRTAVCEDNNNPLFYETLELDYEVADMDDLETYPPFIFDIYDHDEGIFNSTPDFLGRSIVDPENCALLMQKDFEMCELHQQLNCDLCAHLQNDIPKRPKWHAIHYAPGEEKSGEILVSFAATEYDYTFNYAAADVDLKKQIEFKEFDCNMLILGLRNLASPGILPVKKAFISFNIKSLVPPGGPSVKNVETQPQSPGSNPTINTTIKFNVPLPVDPLYCPKLTCTVFDYIFKGFSQPVIGVFVLPMGQLIADLTKERAVEIAEMRKVVDALSQINIQGPQNQVQSYSINNHSNSMAIQTNQKTTMKVNAKQNLDLESGVIQGNYSDDEIEPNQNQIGVPTLAIQDMDDRMNMSQELGEMQIDNLNMTNEYSQYSGQEELDQKNLLSARKQNKKDQKVYGKIFKKKSEVKKDLTQGLGVNEETENQNADMYKNEQLLALKQKRDDLMKAPSSQGGSQKSKLSKLTESKPSAFALGNKNEKMSQIKETIEIEKRVRDDERKKDEEELIKKGQDADTIIKFPQYKKCPRLKVDKEVNIPSSKLYIGLGWDEDATTLRRHYRKFYPDELENDKEIFPQKSPFNTYYAFRGSEGGLDEKKKPKLFSLRKVKEYQEALDALAIKSASSKESCGMDKQVQEHSCSSDTDNVGYFKGIVQVESKESREQYAKDKAQIVKDLKFKINAIALQVLKRPLMIDTEKLASSVERKKFEKQLRQLNIDHLNISTHLCNLESDEILKRMLLSSTKTTIRCNIISAFDLSSRDNGGFSDPYLLVECNGKIFNQRDKYQLDEPCPDFYETFEFEGKFPGTTPLKIGVWDYDMIFGDDLIGTTIVDLEDRFFSIEWQALDDKPIEYRQLEHPSSKMSQGQVKMWIEINDTSVPIEEQPKKWDITPKPLEDFEVRICVLNCENIIMMDSEGTSDVYFRGFFDTKEDVQETDTHFRCSDGKPDFQYRMIFDLHVPRKEYKFSLQAYDRDFFKSNDIIGECSLDIRQIIEDCALVKAPLHYNKNYYTDVVKPANPNTVIEFDKKDDQRMWMELKGKDKKGKIVSNGKVALIVEVLPKKHAEKNVVGKARDNPNHSPQLPQPQGRIELSINPFKMIDQLVGPELRRKIKIGLCCLVYCALFVMILPNVIGALVSQAIAGMLS